MIEITPNEAQDLVDILNREEFLKWWIVSELTKLLKGATQ